MGQSPVRLDARSGGTGCGSEFIVTLPRAADATAPAGRTAPVIKIARQCADKLRILVAERQSRQRRRMQHAA